MAEPILVIDRGAAEPVYQQIARQLREAIASGGVERGASLPSVRRMASDLGVNLNTVARAYRSLQDDGFVGISGRSGVRVAAAGDGSTRRADRFRDRLREVLACLIQAGLSPRELHELLAEELGGMLPPSRGGSS